MNLKQIVNEMTIYEKVGQINQKLYGWEIYEKVDGEIKLTEDFINHVNYFGGIGSIYGILRADPWSQKEFTNGLNQIESQQVLKLVSDYIAKTSRFNIRPLFMEETPHGHQGLNSRLYPTNIGIGASFNPELYKKSIEEISLYMESLNVNIGLFSGLDITRNPKWGRCEETFGEDPYLASCFVDEVVKGCKKTTFNPCLKHFAAQGTPYLGINSSPAVIGERELFEIHIPPIKKAIDSGLKMCMAAYNEIDGIPCHVNEKLLDKTLRQNMGFDGVVLADGGALDRIVSKNNTIDKVANMSLKAGVDLSLWDNVYHTLVDYIKNDLIDMELLDRAVYRILKLKSEMGLIDSDLVMKDIEDVDTKISYQLACEANVLIKNDNILPIDIDKKLLLVGHNLDDLYIMLGDYTPIQNESMYDTLKDYLSKEMVNVEYIDYEQVTLFDEAFYKQFDNVIIAMGGSSKRDFNNEFLDNGALAVSSKKLEMDCGEGCDVGSIKLKSHQISTFEYIFNYNKNIISLVIQGRPYSLGNIYNQSKAIITSYYPGQMGGKALGDIILGRVNPSGKTPISIVCDDAYVGYTYNHRYDIRSQKFVDVDNDMIIPFGFGLSYSQFEYQKLDIDICEKTVDFKVEVVNTSEIDGMEVIQLYVRKFDTITTKRRRELISFEKVEIKKNTEISVSFKIKYDELNVYDQNMQSIFENGSYEFIIGNGEDVYLSEVVELTFNNNTHPIINNEIN